ncbi:uncharacterized protein LOC115006761 [Cottoperca gobio]|uniref:Uncharacterized protein LOC115006761 n=1 Tax=Cottoperca gobio TaxID=56716 RepID=A0A6J2PHM3_COTGO|nr:uncharacterized protein LOC115006761 [Cottoperca gobio]
MFDNVISKPLGLVLIVTAHMVFNGLSQAEITGLPGTNVTLQFTFNVSVPESFAVYTKNHTTKYTQKVAGYSQGKSSSKEENVKVYAKNMSVFFHITNLKLSQSGIYWASLFRDLGLPKESKMVELIVQDENRSSTVPPVPNDITINEDSGSPSLFSSQFVTVLVVSLVVLLAAAFSLLIWCLVRSKDKQQPPPQQSSNPTVQKTDEASNNVPAPPLVYSFLDFPKRPSSVFVINASETEYAAVSYRPENRQG